MTDTTTPVVTNPINDFFAKVKNELEMVEEDVIALIQNIGADVQVVADDISWGLSWLGSHIGQIGATVMAVQNSIVALNAAGVPIPNSLTNAVANINQAVGGVNAALNNQALQADASTALVDGYKATKALQVAAASAAAIAATIPAVTAPAAPTPPPAATGASSASSQS